MKTPKNILITGDLLVLVLVTAYGFASHNTLGSAGARMLTTFLPLLLSWLFVAPLLGVYDPERAIDLRQVWRPFWAMILAAPFAAFLRGLLLGWLEGALLGLSVQPVFVIVLGGVSSLALVAWRGVYAIYAVRKKFSYG